MATPVKKPASSSPQVKRKFAFNLRKPIFTGPILKQGHYHKAFKSRYFILYPGFLVYYESPEKWQYDLQRGDTLGSRLGAIKLKDGSVQKAKNAPKGAKYAFTISCPDTSNRRHEVMFNCHSNEERYQWMSHIQSAIPSSSPKTEKKVEKEEVDCPPPPPEGTLRQDTVSEAALLASSKNDEEEEEEETHTDDILGPVTSPTGTDSGNEDTTANNITDEREKEEDEGEKEDELITSSASVTIVTNTKDEEEDDDTVPLPGYEEDTVPLPVEEQTINEITLPPDEKSQFLISVVDHTLLADSEDDLSEEDPTSPIHRKSSQEGSNTSSPPPPTNDLPPLSPPPPSVVITVTQDTVTKDPTTKGDSKGDTTNNKDTDSGNSSPELGSAFNRDTRRPSGAMSLVDKRGYLYKMGGKVKSWNLRYFLLQPGVFRYFKNDPNGKQLGEVKLKNVKIMLPKEGEKVFSSFQFTIHTESSWNKRRYTPTTN